MYILPFLQDGDKPNPASSAYFPTCSVPPTVTSISTVSSIAPQFKFVDPRYIIKNDGRWNIANLRMHIWEKNPFLTFSTLLLKFSVLFQAQNNYIEIQPDVPASEKPPSDSTQSLQQREFQQEGDGAAALQGAGMMLLANPQPFLPLCDGVKLNQGSITFEDLAVNFSLEEWMLLNPGQKVLHMQIMEEIRGIVDSLDAVLVLNRCLSSVMDWMRVNT
nr:PREDICTED: uncharacterized protein LOC100551560 [Anolis carolinensis]|eukprot:XP_016852014.1 PREDICTED: uncharacterized protein LOC100551560 [Anolis carolinensis]